MIKKITFIICIIIFPIFMSGCWNYVALNELSIVAGIAIDKEVDDSFILNFEILSLQGDSGSGPKATLLESDGKTIFDAVRNARKKIPKKLYFGNVQIIVIDHEIVRDEGLLQYIDFFLRDVEFRETASVIVSQEKTAKEIFQIKLLDDQVFSFDMKLILDKDNEITAATKSNEIYEIFNVMNTEGQSLVLPAVHISYDDEKPDVELNGLAVFNGGTIIGYLSPAESKCFLFVMNEIQGGILTFRENEKGEDIIALEIARNKTNVNVDYEEKEVSVSIQTKTKAYLGEVRQQEDLLNLEVINQMKDDAEQKLEQEILKVIRRTQFEFNSDIFGFGSKLYKSHPKEWKQLEDNWNNIYPHIKINVQSDIHIRNSASFNKS